MQIQGSTGTPYVVSRSRNGNILITSCTCPAGDKRGHCKHRLALLAGDLTRVRANKDADLAQQIANIVAGTEVEEALQALKVAVAKASAATDRLKQAKKALDRAMHQ